MVSTLDEGFRHCLGWLGFKAPRAFQVSKKPLNVRKAGNPELEACTLQPLFKRQTRTRSHTHKTDKHGVSCESRNSFLLSVSGIRSARFPCKAREGGQPANLTLLETSPHQGAVVNSAGVGDILV